MLAMRNYLVMSSLCALYGSPIILSCFFILPEGLDALTGFLCALAGLWVLLFAITGFVAGSANAAGAEVRPAASAAASTKRIVMASSLGSTLHIHSAGPPQCGVTASLRPQNPLYNRRRTIA
jgi:hypothetical protein